METKKNAQANNERLRIPIALMGFLFVGGTILASFTYKATIEHELLAENAEGASTVVYTEEARKNDNQQEEQKHQEEATPPQEIIKKDSISNFTPKSVVTPPKPPQDLGTVEPPKVKPEPVLFPDKEAMFPGGPAELQRWISSNVVYPEVAIQMEDQGKVYLSFVVEADGEITNVKIDKALTKELNREAKRVLRKMPHWEPGEVEGKRVRTICSLPIVFTLK
jgi:protein TonB